MERSLCAIGYFFGRELDTGAEKCEEMAPPRPRVSDVALQSDVTGSNEFGARNKQPCHGALSGGTRSPEAFAANPEVMNTNGISFEFHAVTPRAA